MRLFSLILQIFFDNSGKVSSPQGTKVEIKAPIKVEIKPNIQYISIKFVIEITLLSK